MKNLFVDPVTYDLALDSTNNLRLTENTTEWLSAKLEAKLKTFLGEWFANQNIGIPYYQDILKKQIDLNNVEVIFSEAVKNTAGVKELLEFSVDYDGSTRLYKYTFKVLAETGNIVTGGSTL